MQSCPICTTWTFSLISSFVKYVEPCRACTAEPCRTCTPDIFFIIHSFFSAGNWCLRPHLAVPVAAVRWPALAGGLLEAGARQRGTLQSPALKHTQHSLVTLTVGLEWGNRLMLWTEPCTHMCACMHPYTYMQIQTYTRTCKCTPTCIQMHIQPTCAKFFSQIRGYRL